VEVPTVRKWYLWAALHELTQHSSGLKPRGLQQMIFNINRGGLKYREIDAVDWWLMRDIHYAGLRSRACAMI
jgi:hypothetical protein